MSGNDKIQGQECWADRWMYINTTQDFWDVEGSIYVTHRSSWLDIKFEGLQLIPPAILLLQLYNSGTTAAPMKAQNLRLGFNSTLELTGVMIGLLQLTTASMFTWAPHYSHSYCLIQTWN